MAVSHAVEEDSGSKPDTTDHILRTVVGGTTILYAKMGGTEVQCVVDTGSMVSFVPEAVYKEVLLPQCGKAKGIGNVLTVRGANGLEIPYLGYLELDVEVEGVVIPGCGILILKDTPATVERKRAAVWN